MTHPSVWVPLIIDLADSTHLHACAWWSWTSRWNETNLPRGVKMLTITTARRGCGLCDAWKSIQGWPKDVPKPENATPQAIGTGFFDLFNPEGAQEGARDDQNKPDVAGEKAKSGDFSDF